MWNLNRNGNGSGNEKDSVELELDLDVDLSAREKAEPTVGDDAGRSLAFARSTLQGSELIKRGPRRWGHSHSDSHPDSDSRFVFFTCRRSSRRVRRACFWSLRTAPV